MKRIIEQIKDKNTIRITICTERWYWKQIEDPTLQKVEDMFYPSVTWIAGYYPKGTAFYKWLAEKGWDEAEAIKIVAGQKGSKVHQAITHLVNGGEVTMQSKFMKESAFGEMVEEEIRLEEYEAVMSFCAWYNKVKPEIVDNELVVFSEKNKYAGTIDLVAMIDGKIYIIDVKTGQNIWPSYELQLSAYRHAYQETSKTNDKIHLAILQIGYRRNKQGWKFTKIEDKYHLFEATYDIWRNECGNQKPSVKDYPTRITLQLPPKADSGASV